MHVKPIKTEADLHSALHEIERLWGASAGTPAGDKLDVLIALAEAYEREHVPIDPPDPIDAINFRLDQEGKDYRALVGVLGHRTRVYEVMRRDRPLSLAMIRRLRERFRIPAEILLNPVRRKRAGTKRRAVQSVQLRSKHA